MKHIFYLLVITLFTSCANSLRVEDEVSFAQVDPFLKVFRESNFFPEFNQLVDVAAGEHATFQFAVRSGKAIKQLTAEVISLSDEEGNQLADCQIGFVEYVRVGRETPDKAKDAVASLSHYYPDPIITKSSYDVVRDVTQPIWVTIAIPHDTKPGEYKGTFKIKGQIADTPFSLEKEIGINVYPVQLETPSLWVTNWHTTAPDMMRKFNSGKDVELYSDLYWSMIEELAKKMKDCYQNVVLISPLEHIIFIEKEGLYSFDYTHFDKMVGIFDQAGVLKMMEGGHIATRMGLWDSQFGALVPEMEDGKKILNKYLISSEKAQNFYKQFMPALMQHLREKKWGDLYAQHIANEPTSNNMKSYIEIARFVKQQCPDIKIIEACHTHDLEDILDIWVPQLNFYKEGYDFYCDRQKQGDEVWFYTCLAPQGNFTNRFIELPTIKTRLIHWLNFRYGATGYLHWGLNYWYSDDPFVETTQMNRESGNTLPGGDGWMVYPENGKLYGSIRLEAMRDGIADYTLLKMLERKKPELAKELCRLNVYDWSLYDTESDHFRSIRRQILKELSK